MRRIYLAAATTLALVPIGGPAEAGERQRATVLMAEDEGARKFQENWGFSDAVVTGDTIHLSGILLGFRPGEADLKAPYPAWTAIGVAKILGGGITEIKITAKRPLAIAKGK
ncbi:MAG: hypothetical protein M3N39_13090 [Pseudomonadota bacterium]|nr:hypothetical protein [Pseudomonadota bacterium]